MICRIDFKPSYVFNAVPAGFKIMIAVVSFTLFQNYRKHASVVSIFLMIYLSFTGGSFAVMIF